MAFLVAGTTLLLVFGASPAMADNGPHVSTAFGSYDSTTGTVTQSPGQSNVNTDRCAGCHRAHTASGSFLLTSTDASQLCYSCHGTAGTGATTDVVDGVQYNNSATPPALTRGGTMVGSLRGGGFSKAALGNASVVMMYNAARASISPDKSQTVISADVANQSVTTSSHNVNATGALVAWGGGAAGSGTGTQFINGTALECTSCHDPHGNGNYRILRPVPVGAPSGSVTVPDSATKVYTTTNYWLVDDPYSATVASMTGANNTSAFLGSISAWCSTCHTRILSPSGGYAMPLVSFNTGATYYNISFTGNSTTFTVTTTPMPTINVNDTLAFATITPATGTAANLTAGFMTNVLYRVYSVSGSTITLGNPVGTSAMKPPTGFSGTGTFAMASQTTADGNFMYRHRSDNATLSLQTGVTTRGTAPILSNGQPNAAILGWNNPNCITCHVAHGSNVSMAGDGNTAQSSTVTKPDGSAGDSYLLRVANRGTCRMCHNL